ncbi:hypothetical protein DENSPDRAFT_876443 [Dentipellis sp. KUC8613]|nr:hypothetical protein DENSPDRAFT_876443 [Dentipellis sp. KUC8613]
MNFPSRPDSPPPRVPSPQLLPTPLPSPPPLRSQRSRQRLGLDASPKTPPIPPTLIGSPLLKKGIFAPRARTPSGQLNIDLWLDGDEFGARKERKSAPTTPATPGRQHIPSKGRHRRSESISLSPSHRSPPSPYMRSRSRSRSPPPTPRREPPPPVPPIPSFFLNASDRKGVLQPKATNCDEPRYPPGLTPPTAPSAGGKRDEAMTCMRFFSIHNPRSASQ